MSVIRVFLCGFLLAAMLFVAACGTEEDDELVEWLIAEEAKPPFTSVTTECFVDTTEKQMLCSPGYQPQQ